MFIDRAVIFVRSGNGGHGIAAFHREKFVAAGGPDGGDGGRGGNVIFVVDEGSSTLADFRYKRKYSAENGENGKKNKMTGKNGADVIIKVPQGTIIKEKNSGRVLADMITPGEQRIIAKGGKGGLGNYHFATATRQVPNFAKGGQPGVEMELVLELKLLADVGLVGFPNVGKSTLLSVTTGARPEIANYHFTTLKPNLGVVYCDEGNSFVLADIPGLIEGASDGLGLGHTFLRHVERTRLIVHVIDMSGSEGRDPFEDFLTINNELSLYSPALAKRPQIIAANKMDENGAAENLVIFKEKLNAWLEANEEEVADAVELGAWKIFEICAAIAEGTSQLMAYTGSIVHKMPLNPAFDEADEYVLYDAADEGEDGPLFTVTVDEDGVYVIEGTWIEQVFNSVNLADNESSQYFQRLLRTKGVIDELERLGIQEEDTVRIADTEFDFVF